MLEEDFQRNLAVTKALLDAGADPNARDADGDSPLSMARSEGRKQLVDLMTSRNVNDD